MTRRDIPAPSPLPPRRLPAIPLPAYRYVPGLHPHPLRHEGGHRHAPQLTAEQVLLHGLDLFDLRFYWECHEVLEGRWKTLDRRDPERQLLQGIIQGAAAVLQAHMGHPQGARRLLDRANPRLERAEDAFGPVVADDVDLRVLRQRLEAFIAGGAWPLSR